jgi:hypothetical protein
VDSLASEANQHLARQIARVKRLRRSIFIHPRIISYVDRREESYFREIYVDALDRDVVSTLWKTTRNGPRNVILAAFTTYTDVDRDMWHAWGMAMIKDQSGGTHLLIYDCDGFEPDTPAFPLFLIESQQHMIEALRKRISIQKAWVSCDLSRAQQNQCYQNTMDWIEAMVTQGDHMFRGERDPRIVQGKWRSYVLQPISRRARHEGREDSCRMEGVVSSVHASRDTSRRPRHRSDRPTHDDS